ncbi:MAG TPA: isoleucine--tRNA ligase [Patescibacteria group bacterium]|nr:isoleucine--tRNA ligase [Patescibacteria group bacterium]
MARNKTYFEPVEQNVNFPELEKKLLSDWYKKGVVKKYLNRNKTSKKYFSFIDGPITANNPMGVHHAWGRTYKDLWRRFKNMQGFNQLFQNGFDAQGLWVEVEVEKELGFTNKKDIEKFGVAKFVQLCRDRVKKYSGIQTEQTKRLGNFMDWDHSYYTLSDDNNYMIWTFLKRCFENGWIYKGHESVPWCPRCETAISQHEMLTEDYKVITHQSVYLAFPIVGQSEEYLLVWTTTPWTVPANIAVAVDSELDYSLVEVGKRKYWIAKDSKDRVVDKEDHKVLKTVKGSKLVGLRYTGAFDDLPKVAEVAKGKNDMFHTVVATDNFILPITVTEGTGLVHTAVSAGTEDFKLGKKLGLPMIPVIEDDASYMSELGFLSGLNAKKHPEVVLDYLKKLDAEGKHFYFKIENYTHRYPACWRCKTELVWKVADEWYIAMDKGILKSKVKNQKSEVTDWAEDDEKQQEVQDLRTLRQRMKDSAAKINWIPGFGLAREMDWLDNMHDWLISKKNRYWGLALPIWECTECGNFEVIGSKEELEERAVKGWAEFKGKTPHKPQIDGVKIKCSNCGNVASRIEPVGNPWLDAGIVPFSTISENNEAANFEVTKTKPLYLTNKKAWQNWFPADFITESFPGQFKNWFYSLIAMSTVLEDINPMKTVLGYGTLSGADGRPMHKSWGNSIEFNEGADIIGADVMRWMYSRANPADNMLFGYKIADEVRRRFHLKLWNVYNFFVTYANLDGFQPLKDQKSKIKSQNVLDQWILARLNQTIAVVTNALEKYDAFTGSGEIEKFVDDLSLWYVRRSRDRVGPASESEKDKNNFYQTNYFVLVTLSKIMAPFTPFLSEFMYKNLTKEESVHLSDWPKSLGKVNTDLVEEMLKVRELVETAHSVRKENSIPVRQPLNSYTSTLKAVSKNLEYLIKDEINVKNLIWGSKSNKLDMKITKELEEEASIRDLIRKIQDARKELGLNLTQRADVVIDEMPTNTKLVQWMTKKAQISSLKVGKFKVSKAS